jgi:hypothetical protein
VALDALALIDDPLAFKLAAALLANGSERP